MKKILSLAIILLCGLSAYGAEDKFFFADKKSMPDVRYFLPGPPQKGTYGYTRDSILYIQGKELRNTKLGEIAVEYEKLRVKQVMRGFGKIMGLPLNEKDYPMLAKLIEGTIQSARNAIFDAKTQVGRLRPYQDFNEPSINPREEEPGSRSSYPSGHASRAWIIAMLFVTLDPEHQHEYLKLGYEITQSRVVGGFHYQSDVDDSRLEASACFARLVADPEFMEYIAKAKEEIAKGRKAQSK